MPLAVFQPLAASGTFSLLTLVRWKNGCEVMAQNSKSKQNYSIEWIWHVFVLISFMKVSSDEDDTKRFIPFRANLPNNSAAGHDQRLAHLPCDRACLARFAKDLGMASLIRQPLESILVL